MIPKLVLGTAQFGLDYGIKNVRGKIRKNEVFEILEYANLNGVKILDTAFNYGDSEKVIGEFIEKTATEFYIISKLPVCNQNEVLNFFEKSISALKISRLLGYLIHDMRHFLKNTKIWDNILQLKKQGKVKYIGFSIYTPDELERIISEKFEFDIIQLPYNILDQRFADFFQLLNQKKIKVFVRSVFLQGILLMDSQKLPNYFKKITKKIRALKALSQEHKIPLSAICLQFAVSNPYIDNVIMGIDSKENLIQNIRSFKFQPQVKAIYSHLLDFSESDEKIILPTFWPKH